MKVCLAGTACLQGENKKIIGESDYILESFYYIENWQIPALKKCKLFLLDSGAFTMFSSGHNMTEKDWDDYVTKYINFINEHDIKYFFELDIDRLVGLKKVEEIRRRIEKETGKKCIPVWHKERGWKYFEKMCKEYDYVAIGGIAKNPNGKQIEKLFPYFIKFAHQNKCKIHGLGYTSVKGLKKYHFDTVDSTSWTSTGRFGSIPKFKDGKLITVKKPQNARIKKSALEELQKISYREWVKFQKYADKNL